MRHIAEQHPEYYVTGEANNHEETHPTVAPAKKGPGRPSHGGENLEALQIGRVTPAIALPGA